MVDEWWSAVETKKCVESLMGPYLAPRAIACRARDGLLRTKARRFLVNDIVFDNTVLPPEFWWAGGETALAQNWYSGDFETRIDRDRYFKAYGVEFLRADVETMLPKQSTPIQQALETGTVKEKANLGTVERKSLLKMVITMAMKKYRYVPSQPRSDATAKIASDMRELGLPLDEDTIRKYLSEAKSVLEDAQP
jgi:hypothetical protein